jgi:muramoyltetrapeptide carboxypeptidase LdcA involved in peptidoglycan recycling
MWPLCRAVSSVRWSRIQRSVTGSVRQPRVPLDGVSRDRDATKPRCRHPRWPDWRGKIMFWEGGDELHTIEQGLVQLSLMGAFDELAGMIIGRVSNLPESLYPRDQVAPLDTLLLDIIGLRGKFPIIKDADIGHNAENVTIPVGAEATLRVAGDAISCAVANL